MQFIVGRFKLYSIVKLGNYILMTGLTISLLGSKNIDIVIAGLFIHTLGVGIANGCIMRLIMSIKGYSHVMLASMLGVMQAILFAVILTIMNAYFSYFQFSLMSFTISSFVFGLIAFFIISNYIVAYRDRKWH